MSLAEMWLVFYFGLGVVAIVWGAGRIGKPREPYTHREWMLACVFFVLLWASVWQVSR